MRRLFPLLISFLILWSCNTPEDLVVPEIKISGSEQLGAIPADAYSGSIDFNATADWTAEVNYSGDEAWISVSPTSGTAGENCNVKYSVKANTSESERSAKIILSCGDQKKTLTLTQKEANALILNESRVELGVKGGSFTIQYRTNVDCSFAISADAASWIQASSSKALSNHSFTFVASQNEAITKREGKIIISGAGLSEEFSVFQAGEIPDFVLSKDEITVSDEGGEFKVEVSSNVDVTLAITEGSSWVKEVKSKSMSLKTFTFSADKNEGVEARTAKILLTNTEYNLSKTVTVTQMQKDAIVVAPASVQLGPEGGIVTFSVGHNVEFDTILSDRWITKLEATKAYSEDKLSFSIALNSSYSSREGTIIFKSKNSGKELSQTVTIEQAAKDAIFIVSEKRNSFSATGGELTVKLNHNISYEVKMPAVDWVRKVSTKALSESVENFEILANENVESRETEIVFINSELNLSDTVYISQTQRDALVIAPESVKMLSEGGEISFTVGHNVDFDVNFDVDWIKNTPKTKSYVEENVNFEVDPNTTNDSRTGSITFTSKDKSLSQTVSVIQEGLYTIIVTSDKNPIFSCYEELLTVTVNHNLEFDVVMPAVGWIHQVTTKSLDETKLYFQIDENKSVNNREAVITFKSKDDKLSDNVTVFQAQKDALVVSPGETTMVVGGGELSFLLGHNVEFNTTIDVPWISLAPAVKSYVEETVKFTVEANPDTKSRIGHITFSSLDNALVQIVTITQDPVPELKVTSSKENDFKAEGGTLTVSISANIEYNVVLPSGGWIHEISGAESGTHKFTIDANNSMSGRNAAITFKSKDGKLSDSVNIIQAGDTYFLDSTGFGAYNIESKTTILVQDKYADQIGCMTGTKYAFKIMNPASRKYFQLGSIPLSLKVGDSFTATILQSYTSSLIADGNYKLTVIQMKDGKVWLLTSNGKTGFIIKK